MRIGDAAAAAGVTTRTLRYYEQRGLLTAQRSESGYREYAQQDVRRLLAIRELLDSGLTVGDVQFLVQFLDEELDEAPAMPAADTGPPTCPVPQVAYRRLAALDDRIRRLSELRARLADQLDDGYAALVGELIGSVPQDDKSPCLPLTRR